MENRKANYISVFNDILTQLRNLFPECKIIIFPVFETKRISNVKASKYNLGITDFLIDGSCIFGIAIKPNAFVNNLLVDGVHFKDLVYDYILQIIHDISLDKKWLL